MTTDADDHASVRELLGAWAVRALPQDEQRSVPRHLADCEECAAEAERLRETVRLLNGVGQTDAPAPSNLPLPTEDPRTLPTEGPRTQPTEGPRTQPTEDPRTRSTEGLRALSAEGPLARALSARPPVSRAAAPHVAPYAAAVAALQGLLAELDDPARPESSRSTRVWSTRVVHDWTVQDTVAHLIAADEHLAVHLGLPFNDPPAPPGPATPQNPRTAWASRTYSVIAHERPRPPQATVATWRSQAAGLLATPAARDPERAARAATLLGLRLPVADHFLVRGFETWIHTDDIGRALGYPVPPPPTAHLWRLVRLGVRVLGGAVGPQASPVALTVADATGGTEWILGPEGEPVRAELVLDPVDFCLLIGGRATPATVPKRASGDEEAVAALLDRAAGLAWL